MLNKQTSSIAGGPRRFLLVPAILGLCALASPMQSARAQTCGNLLSAGPVISPISGSKVVAGQTITITRYTVASAFGNCLFQNGVAFYADPSGAVTETLTNFSVAPGGQINCDGTPAGGDASCLPFATTYVVNPADAGRTLSIVLPPRGQFSGATEIYAGAPNEIHFFGAADCDGFDPSNPGSPTGPGSGTSAQRLILVHPGLMITKVCDTNCFLYGAPISFHGSVCNTGDVTLVNITVTDSPPVAITFAATASSGRPFSPATGLTNGECVAYSGSYAPAGAGAALCGPFTDTVIASATVSGVSPVVTVFATNSAVCTVCTSPGISVTKQCPPTNAVPGSLLTFTGTVCNTGNVPLTNVSVFNDRILNTGTNLVASYPLLTNGECRTFSGSYVVPTNVCSVTDTLTASGTNLCTGFGVVSTATTNCPIVTTPQLAMTKTCPVTNAAPGTLIIYTGTITNTGNVAVTNVVIVNNQPAPNTPVTTIARLEPGQGTNFIGTELVPSNVCSIADMLSATARDVCGNPVITSATAICPVVVTPRLALTKVCPPTNAAPGTLLVYSGTLTNIGNVAVTNITLTDSIFGTNAPAPTPSLIARLEPGQGTNFTGSYTVPVDVCAVTDTVMANGTDVCGNLVTTNVSQTCAITNTPRLALTKVCPPTNAAPGTLLIYTGTLTNIGNVAVTNITLTDSIFGTNTAAPTPAVIGRLEPGQGTTFTGSYVVPVDVCSVTDTVRANGADVCGTPVGTNVSQTCLITNTPRLSLTKTCPPTNASPGTLLVYTGTVTNIGNVAVTNVTLTDSIFGTNTAPPVPSVIARLEPGQGASFTGSYTVPPDVCSVTDTVRANGADLCGTPVSTNVSQTCIITNSPGIAVSKACPANPVPPGGTLIVTGTVTNIGNITLTNVTITNVIAALGQTHLVLGPISLAPGAGLAFSDQYVTPLDSCGPYRDTFIASGTDKCFGRLVMASAFKDCPGITTPRIAVIKHCPANPVVPGGLAIFSGSVSNAGNITLTNVIVVNDRPTNNTPVFGPVTLAPGQSTNFTGSEIVPPNCCSYFDTLLATGASACTGSNVSASATAVCPTLITPKLAVKKNCPPNPAPLGQPLVFTGTVSNAGDITLIGVTVVNNQPTNNTPVLGPITLAPGETANLISSYIVPINICDTNIADTLTARGSDVCLGSNVAAMASAVCPIFPTPRLAVTKQCPPNPVAPGDLLIYTGTVSNSGNITITNVTVVDDRPAPNTPVLGPITLVPGQVVSFSGSYRAPYDCCGPCVDTVTARGNDFCMGSNVMATASAACPRISTPRIAVTRDCPPGTVTEGEMVFFTGVVSNTGNATLGNVLVVDDQAGDVVDNLTLAPGEGASFMGMYVPTNCGPSVPSAITASGTDVCTSIVVSNRFITACSVICPSTATAPVLAAGLNGTNFVFSFATESNRSYTVQFTDAMWPIAWQTLTNFAGDGTVATIPDSITSNQRFYRVMAQ